VCQTNCTPSTSNIPLIITLFATTVFDETKFIEEIVFAVIVFA